MKKEHRFESTFVLRGTNKRQLKKAVKALHKKARKLGFRIGSEEYISSTTGLAGKLD